MVQLILVIVCTHTTVVNITSDKTALSLGTYQTYTQARLPGYEISHDVGAPEVPVKPVRVALPYGARVSDVRILSTETEVLTGSYVLTCVQEPVILSQKQLTTTEPKEEIYQSDALYPANIIEFKGTYYFDNYTICELLFYPLQCSPLSQELRFHSSVSVALSYEGGVRTCPERELIKNVVINPNDVAPPSRSSGLPFEYLIITDPPLDTVMQRLADWKTKKGIRAELRTVAWILAHYAGEDNAACVRNYIKAAVDSGVHYVLLAGDVDVVPHRRAYAMTCEWGGNPREDSLPCDLYYADLQGDWDRDNDGTYGEIEDSIDLYPDIMVGRAPINTISEAQTFVNKVLTYEKNPALGYQDNAQFAADILWSYPYTDMAVHKERIEDESFPDYFTFNKLYQSVGNASPAAFLDGLHAGQNLINHDGHGYIGSMTVGGMSSLHNIDFDTLTNAPQYGTLISIGCWTAAFDYNSIGESFINSPGGGGIAYIGNSSYGWGAPGNPGFGYSDRYDSRFFYSLLKENNVHVGEALAMAKAYFAPYAREQNVYRWIQYQLNLLGDPEMSIQTAIPESLDVTYPQSVPIGTSHILITVRDRTTYQPVRNALVCIMKGNETYESAYTDASGTVMLKVTPATAGTCELTVTCHNFLPVETTIPVVSGSYINFTGWNIHDTLGNDDGIANPNESMFLDVMLKNTGNESAHTIGLLLRSSDSLIRIDDSVAIVPTLDPGDSVFLNEAFEVFTYDASNGYGIHFQLYITYSGDTVTNYPILLIGTPDISINEVIVIQQPSLPNENDSLYVQLINTGYGIGHETYATMTSSDPNIAFLEDSVWYEDINPESRAIADQPFVIAISHECPVPHLATLSLAIHTNDYSFSDTISMLIGETGLVDDMESGDSLWTTGGADNLWHISTQSAHSPSHAWYCGDTTIMQYHDDMDCYIQTVPFLLDENSKLSFYRWFNVPVYGSDGVYVIVMNDGLSDTLDFIGTGGALGTKDIQSDWFREEYSLADYTAGDSIQIRIAFTSDSDGDVGQGFFIDDVRVEAHADAAPRAPCLFARKVADDVQLFWQPVTTDTLGNIELIDHYAVYRDTTAGFVPQSMYSIGNVQYPDTTFTDSGVLLEQQCYYYLVIAVDVTGKHSTKSNMASLVYTHVGN